MIICFIDTNWFASNLTPYAKQCWQLHSIRAYPTECYHHGNPMGSIDSGIGTMVCDHNISTLKIKNRIFGVNSFLTKFDLKVGYFYRFIVIMAIQSNETPTLPYCKNGIILHKASPWVHVPCMKRNALNGNTIKQNKQSAMHKLKIPNKYLVSTWKWFHFKQHFHFELTEKI